MITLDKFQKTFRCVLALVLFLFMTGLENVEAAYATTMSPPAGFNTKFSSEMKTDDLYAIVADRQCGQGCDNKINKVPDDKSTHHGHINACELQITVIALADMLTPNSAEIDWWKPVVPGLDSIDRMIKPKPPKSM